MASKRVAVITASTRKPRVNPFIAQHVHDLIKPHAGSHITLETVAIADQGLPFFDESNAPKMHPKNDPTPHYAHAHTRSWSSIIRKYDAFIFVTPQYNWTIPPTLTNAIDFLYWEWSEKPAGIVSYGGHGGGHSASHLRNMLTGMDVNVVPTAGAFGITLNMAKDCTETGKIDEPRRKLWKENGADEGVVKMFGELKEALELSAASRAQQ